MGVSNKLRIDKEHCYRCAGTRGCSCQQLICFAFCCAQWYQFLLSFIVQMLLLTLQMATVRAIVPAPKNKKKMQQKIKAVDLAIIDAPKSTRKGRLHLLRLDLPNKDSRGCDKYILDVGSKEGTSCSISTC